MGALVPLLAEKFHFDPTVASAPLIAPLVDATGLALYMALAQAVLKEL